MIGSLDDDVMHTEPVNRPVRAPDGAFRLNIPRQGSKLVGNHPHRPLALTRSSQAKNLRRCFVFVPPTKWAAAEVSGDRLDRAMYHHLFRPLGALGSNN